MTWIAVLLPMMFNELIHSRTESVYLYTSVRLPNTPVINLPSYGNAPRFDRNLRMIRLHPAVDTKATIQNARSATLRNITPVV